MAGPETRPNDEPFARAQEAGFDLHFVKPLDLARLARVLSTLDRESA
jgi:hypothetical protein